MNIGLNQIQNIKTERLRKDFLTVRIRNKRGDRYRIKLNLTENEIKNLAE